MGRDHGVRARLAGQCGDGRSRLNEGRTTGYPYSLNRVRARLAGQCGDGRSRLNEGRTTGYPYSLNK
jgi:hypothetical protein